MLTIEGTKITATWPIDVDLLSSFFQDVIFWVTQFILFQMVKLAIIVLKLNPSHFENSPCFCLVFVLNCRKFYILFWSVQILSSKFQKAGLKQALVSKYVIRPVIKSQNHIWFLRLLCIFKYNAHVHYFLYCIFPIVSKMPCEL